MKSFATTQEASRTGSEIYRAASDCKHRTHPPSTTRADDTGFTPAEIIIGVILVAILATGVTVKAVQLMGRARDSAAQTTLRTAVAAAGAVYSDMLPGGYNNFSHKKPETTGIIGDNTATNNATYLAAQALSENEPAVNFVPKAAPSTSPFGLLNASPPRPHDVWVDTIQNLKEIKHGSSAVTITGYANPNGNDQNDDPIPANLTITAGDLIRMGIVAASGNSFCVILVQNDSHNRVSGEGWQAVNEAGTQGNMGADCGAERTANAIFLEMPDVFGTDPKTSAIVTIDGLSTTLADAQAYDAR